VIEDCWVRGQPGHRQFVHVAIERATVQQVARDVVEPETLAQVVQQLGSLHNERLI
jgi:predicted RNA binding protein YcfA (HicA-like mRNA interferase family)